MVEENKPEGKVVSYTGIYVGGNLTQGDILGQSSAGKDNLQINVQPSPTVDIEELKNSLLAFQEELVNIDLSPEVKEIVKGDVNAAFIETRKEEPKLQNIQTRVKSVIETLKEAGKTAKNISETCGSLKTLASLLGIAL